MNGPFAAALDLAGREAGLALLDGTKILLSVTRPMRGRESAQLAAWAASELDKAGVGLDAIAKWSVGSGPGSFTGMRLAAALVNGWSFGKTGVRTRCVPTAVALAANLPAPAEGSCIGALFDGRNRELIWFELVIRNGEPVPTGREQILNAEQAAAFFAGCPAAHLIAFEAEKPALEKLLAPEVAAKIEAFASVRPEALALAQYKPFDNQLADLVYIRPAVFS